MWRKGQGSHVERQERKGGNDRRWKESRVIRTAGGKELGWSVGGWRGRKTGRTGRTV